MFSKLIKHEWKALFKQNSIIFLTLIVSSLITSILLIVSGKADNFSSLVLSPFIFLYYLILISAPLASIIIFAIRFYTSTYGQEGYLTNTLPLKPYKIILSKLITGSLYSIIINFLVLVSMAMVLFSWLGFSKQIPLEEIQLMLNSMPSFTEFTGMSSGFFIVYFIIVFILSALSSSAMIIGSISFGHLWSKHKILGSIVSYVCIYFVMQIISIIFIMPTTTKLSLALVNNADPYVFSQGYLKLLLTFIPILSLVIGVSLYFISTHILKKKINLD